MFQAQGINHALALLTLINKLFFLRLIFTGSQVFLMHVEIENIKGVLCFSWAILQLYEKIALKLSHEKVFFFLFCF